MKLKCDEPRSNFAFNFNLRRYIKAQVFFVLAIVAMAQALQHFTPLSFMAARGIVAILFFLWKFFLVRQVLPRSAFFKFHLIKFFLSDPAAKRELGRKWKELFSSGGVTNGEAFQHCLLIVRLYAAAAATAVLQAILILQTAHVCTSHVF